MVNKTFLKFKESDRKGFVKVQEFKWTKTKDDSGKLTVKQYASAPTKVIGRKKLCAILSNGKVRESCKLRDKPVVVENNDEARFYIAANSTAMNYVMS